MATTPRAGTQTLPTPDSTTPERILSKKSVLTLNPSTRSARRSSGRNSVMNVTIVPDIRTRVSDLLENCRFSGWVRKQGGKHKNWRKRYLVLTQGCCYYFEKETAEKAKGCFSLRGYRVEKGDAMQLYQFIIKVVPNHALERTYFIALAAKHEQEAWIRHFQEEINDTQITLSGEEEIYSAISDSDSGDEEDVFPFVGGSAKTQDHVHEATTLKLKGPPVPERPPETLPKKGSIHKVPESHDFLTPEPDSTYISLIGNGPRQPLPPSPKQQLKPQQRELPQIPNSKPISISKPSVPSRPDNVIADVPPQVDNDDLVEDWENGNGSEDIYYVDKEIIEQQLQTKTYELSREDAKLSLTSRAVNGMFLLRTSQHAGTTLVISVWHENECKHYKLFQDEHKGFSLTHGAFFQNLTDLISHYKKEFLPKSCFTLSVPYR